MAKRNEKPTAEKEANNKPVHRELGRRKLLQIGGIGLTVGALGTVGASAGSNDLPNTIVFNGTVSPENAAYEFGTSGSVAGHPDIGTNDSSGDSTNGHVTNEIGDEIHAYQFDGSLSYLDIDGAVEISIEYGGDTAETDRLEIVASSDGEVEYEISSPEAITKVLDNGDRSANPGEDTVTETDDGTWIVEGATENGYGDTYDFDGEIEQFVPITGDFTLFFNGEETTVSQLTGQEAPEEEEEEVEPDREHWYSIQAIGDDYVDYYFEVQEGGDMIASTVDDAVIEDAYHWINDEETKAAGRIQPGDTHAYAFDTNVADVTIEGDALATVNGVDSSIDWYPRPEATGDYWKGYFPWQIDGEERQHWYSFEATGDDYVDYYFEVEDGGEIIPSMIDDAVIDYEYFAISDDGTKGAGRVHPGDTHAFAFDTSLLDVTVQGDVDATVNGRPSDLDWYPRPDATGDGWKSGFPWQDDDEGVATTAETGNGVIGGGSGYENTVSQSEADAVVRSRSELSSALSNASYGDVVFIPGSESINLGSSQFRIPDGVTVASDRGVDGSSGAFLYTNREDSRWFYLHGSSRLTGIHFRGPRPGDDWGGTSGVGISVRGNSEIDNCEIRGFTYSGIRTERGDGAHIHHNVFRENNTSGLGYGVEASSGTPVIEYNYFNNNRHSIATTGDNPGYILRYNHFGPKEVMHNIDAHHPAGERYEIHNNIVETIRREWDDNINHAINVRGVPDDVAMIRDNWFFNDNAPDSNGSPDVHGQTIVQENVSSWTNMDFHDNHYGENSNVSYSDIIPGYDGWRS